MAAGQGTGAANDDGGLSARTLCPPQRAYAFRQQPSTATAPPGLFAVDGLRPFTLPEPAGHTPLTVT
jgi:hypothetical protein